MPKTLPSSGRTEEMTLAKWGYIPILALDFTDIHKLSFTNATAQRVTGLTAGGFYWLTGQANAAGNNYAAMQFRSGTGSVTAVNGDPIFSIHTYVASFYSKGLGLLYRMPNGHDEISVKPPNVLVGADICIVRMK